MCFPRRLAVLFLCAAAIPGGSARGQIPRLGDPFLVMDRIREPVPVFANLGFLNRLLPTYSYSGSIALQGIGRFDRGGEPASDALGTFRAHISPSRAQAVNWELSGSATAMTHDVRGGRVQATFTFGPDSSAQQQQFAFFTGASTVNQVPQELVLDAGRDAWAGVTYTTPPLSLPGPQLAIRLVATAEADWAFDDATSSRRASNPLGHFALSVPLLFNKMGVPGVMYSYERSPSYIAAGALSRHHVSLIFDPRIVDNAGHHIWNERAFPELLIQFAAHSVSGGATVKELRIAAATDVFWSKLKRTSR